MVLEGIEEGMRTEMSDAGPLPKRLSIEHFMPQGWMEHWDSPVTDDPEDEPVAIRNSLIHTMGNLTLVTKKLNASMANAGLLDKREALDTHSSLFLNKDLLSHSRAGWNEDDIRERADRMWEVARSVWPRP